MKLLLTAWARVLLWLASNRLDSPRVL